MDEEILGRVSKAGESENLAQTRGEKNKQAAETAVAVQIWEGERASGWAKLKGS